MLGRLRRRNGARDGLLSGGRRRRPHRWRPADAARHAPRDNYLAQVTRAIEALVRARYLLAEDLEDIVNQAAQHYDLLFRYNLAPDAVGH